MQHEGVALGVGRHRIFGHQFRLVDTVSDVFEIEVQAEVKEVLNEDRRRPREYRRPSDPLESSGPCCIAAGIGIGASTTGASATGRGASLSLGASTIEFRSITTAASTRACNSPPTASRASSPTRSPTTRGIQSATSSPSASPGSRTTLTHRGRGHAAKLVLTAL